MIAQECEASLRQRVEQTLAMRNYTLTNGESSDANSLGNPLRREREPRGHNRRGSDTEEEVWV